MYKFMIGTLFPSCSDIFDAMFTSKANAGDVIIQQGNNRTRLIDLWLVVIIIIIMCVYHNIMCVCVCVSRM